MEEFEPSFPVMRLWEEWMPSIEKLDRRIIWCRSCQSQLCAPFRDRCAKCAQELREEFESRIRRRRKHTGFGDCCMDCHTRDRVWVASYEYYIITIKRTEYDNQLNCTAYYDVQLCGPVTCALCETCLEKMVNAPRSINPNRVIWGRNIHYIRKAIPSQLEAVSA